MTDIAIVGENHYARQGIASLLKLMGYGMQVKASVRDYHALETILDITTIDVVFISEPEKISSSFECLYFIRKIKTFHPQVHICLFSVYANSLLWVQGEVDTFISLKVPVYAFHANIIKLVDKRFQKKCKKVALELSIKEWEVLRGLKKGLSLRGIAEVNNLSYRRVSALKISAIRKLGLRNNTDLMIFLTR